MKKIWNKKFVFFLLLSFITLMLLFYDMSYASDLKNEINNINLNNIDVNNIDIDDALSYYEDYLSQNYTNDELANIIEQESDTLIQKGIDPDLISTGTSILRTCDSEEVADIIKNDLNIEEIKENLGEDYTTEELFKTVQEQMTPKKYLTISFKLLLSSYIVKICLLISFILLIYSIIITWRIYHKAGKHEWASIIPIYRQIVLFKICGFNPWLLLLIFVPVLGWVILFFISVFMKFRLAKAFDKGFFFGLGLLFFPIIFESILAFSKVKYVGINI